MFPLRIVPVLSGVVIFMSQIVLLTPNGNFGLCHYCIQWAIYRIFYFCLSNFMLPRMQT